MPRLEGIETCSIEFIEVNSIQSITMPRLERKVGGAHV